MTCGVIRCQYPRLSTVHYVYVPPGRGRRTAQQTEGITCGGGITEKNKLPTSAGTVNRGFARATNCELLRGACIALSCHLREFGAQIEATLFQSRTDNHRIASRQASLRLPKCSPISADRFHTVVAVQDRRKPHRSFRVQHNSVCPVQGAEFVITRRLPSTRSKLSLVHEGKCAIVNIPGGAIDFSTLILKPVQTRSLSAASCSLPSAGRQSATLLAGHSWFCRRELKSQAIPRD